MKPLLLLDVDGPINPYRLITTHSHRPPKARVGEEPYIYERHLLRPSTWVDPEPLPVLISKEMGADLAALQDLYTMVWATTWEEDGNALLAPLLGLPPLPVIAWPEAAQEWALFPRHKGTWKTRWILRWLDDFARLPDGTHTPWVWIDDEIGPGDGDLVRKHYGEQRGELRKQTRWLLQIQPMHGLRRNDLVDLREWAED